MSYFDHQEQIRLEVRRCFDCGRFWAIEVSVASRATCPHCADRRTDEKIARIEGLLRSNASLRGALTRLRGAG